MRGVGRRDVDDPGATSASTAAGAHEPAGTVVVEAVGCAPASTAEVAAAATTAAGLVGAEQGLALSAPTDVPGAVLTRRSVSSELYLVRRLLVFRLRACDLRFAVGPGVEREVRAIGGRPPNGFWIPRTEEQQRTVVEAAHVVHCGFGADQRAALDVVVTDVDSHVVALQRLFAEYLGLSDADRDTEVTRKLARIVEVEAARLVARFGTRSDADPAFEYEVWRFGCLEQLAELYKVVCLDGAAILLADAIVRNDGDGQRWYSQLCRENSLYRAMHNLYQRDRPKWRRQPSNTGYFQPSELAELFSMREGAVQARVSDTEGRLCDTRSNVNAELVDPREFLPAGGRVYHMQQWRPLSEHRKDRKL